MRQRLREHYDDFYKSGSSEAAARKHERMVGRHRLQLQSLWKSLLQL